jgi:2-C-methyl-D-erythritol 2,4-cyclodiphosphate synthase
MLSRSLPLLLSLLAILSAGTTPCDAFAAAAVAGGKAGITRRLVLASAATSADKGGGGAATTAAAAAADDDDDDDAVTDSEISSLLRPPYEIEPIPLRIGHGFDIHRMVPYSEAKQPLVVGGVIIDHADQKWTDRDGTYTGIPGSIYETQLGVLAHSDGDVIYHSLVDAIFGALTLPDIGQVFQDTDPRWRGCDSSKFMEHAYDVMSYYGYRIGNVDVTLILERPKVSGFKQGMKENIVRLLHTTNGRVNIKARTHERLDSVGELRSLSCHVVITLEKLVEDS